MYAHELGHAIDAKWIDEPMDISDDPALWKVHTDHIETNESVDPYYYSRKEWFAEGYALIIANASDDAWLSFCGGSIEAVDALKQAFKRYGVVK